VADAAREELLKRGAMRLGALDAKETAALVKRIAPAPSAKPAR